MTIPDGSSNPIVPARPRGFPVSLYEVPAETDELGAGVTGVLEAAADGGNEPGSDKTAVIVPTTDVLVRTKGISVVNEVDAAVVPAPDAPPNTSGSSFSPT